MSIRSLPNKEKGFTLVEVLIALIIFTVAITGLITVASMGEISIGAARNKLTARYLAEEGVELMRARRDTIAVSATDFETGWTDFTTAIAPCGVACDITATDPDVIESALCTANSSTVCPNLYYNAAGYYTHRTTTGSQTIFSRTLSITQLSADEIVVTATIRWMQGAALQTYTLSENLYNWYGT